MKRALRNPDTTRFIKNDLGETELIDEAHCFDNYQAAFNFCKNNHLSRVELVVQMSDRYEFIVDVPQDVGVTKETQPSAPPSISLPEFLPGES
jgi:hypothetical protein